MSKKKKTLDELLEEALVPEEEHPYDVPENWLFVKMGTIAEGQHGYAFKSKEYSEDGIPIIRMGNVVGSNEVNLSNEKLVYIDEGRINEFEKFIIEQGDILMSLTDLAAKGEFLGTVAFYNQDKIALLNQRLLKIVYNSKEVYPKFMFYSLKSPYFRKYVTQPAGGSIQKNISSKFVLDYEFPLPPTNEQKRIANKIETLFSKIDEAKQLIEEAKESFELRRAAIIKELIDKAVSRVSSDALEYKPLSEVYKIFGGGTPRKSNKNYWDGKVNWFSAKDIKTIYLENSMDKITELGIENSSAKIANKGSIVIVTRSGILQHSLPVAKLMVDATVNQDLKVFSSDNQLLNDFLLWYIQANEKHLLEEYSKSGTTVNSIEFDRFKNLKIPILPDYLLHELLINIQNVINQEDKVYQLLNGENHLELLKQSILSKAFKGELGTNDPTDEPAIELLKSILQEKL